jgi:hypothetical protein
MEPFLSIKQSHLKTGLFNLAINPPVPNTGIIRQDGLKSFPEPIFFKS